MLVLTLNTNTSELVQRGDHDPALVAQLRQQIRQGGGPVPGHPDWEFQTSLRPGGGNFSILLPDRTTAMVGMVCGVAGLAEVKWTKLERLYLQAADEAAKIGWGRIMPALPAMPAEIPWVGVIILPHLFEVLNQTPGWLVLFQHALAWAVVAEINEDPE